MLRRRPLASAKVTLYTPAQAGVLLQPAEGRWPAHEPPDRLALGLGTAALAASRIDDERFPALRDVVAGLAKAAVALEPGDDLPPGLVPLVSFGATGTLDLVPWEGEGRVTVTTEITNTAGGVVPTYEGDQTSEGVTAICAMALLMALAVDAGADDRLALALGLEGIASWYAQSHRMTPPRNALTYAITHARQRVRAAGRPLPPALAVEG